MIKFGEVWGTVSRTLKAHPAIKTDSLGDPTVTRQLQDFSIKVRAFFLSQKQKETSSDPPLLLAVCESIRLVQESGLNLWRNMRPKGMVFVHFLLPFFTSPWCF